MRWEAPSDASLMVRMRDGDAQAFAVLYRRYYEQALYVAREVSRSNQGAEEGVQEGFLSVWRSRMSYDVRRGSPQTWILTLTRNRCIDALRHERLGNRRRAPDFHLDLVAASGCLAEDSLTHDDACRALGCLRHIPLAQRDVIALAYVGDLSHTEIARRLNLPLGTVKGRLRLGLDKVRDLHEV
jgi:RNA polymerase sigma-70 factor (ECF subfamily)